MKAMKKKLATKPWIISHRSPRTIRMQEKHLQRRKIRKILRNNTIQAKEGTGGGRIGPSLGLTLEIQSFGGAGLPLSKQGSFLHEKRSGIDHSEVRIYSDSRANQLARSVNTKGFTLGGERTGKYHPGAHEDMRLTAQELMHVVQSRHAHGSDDISRIPGENTTIQRSLACLYPTYPGMHGVKIQAIGGGYTWYPHDFIGKRKRGDVEAITSASGYYVPRSENPNYNCMRWAAGHGVPGTKDYWKGEPRSRWIHWPEEVFLRAIGCKEIRSTDSADHRVKLYENKSEDKFHAVRQEADGTWSSKLGAGRLYRGIRSPDAHTSSHYKPMSQLKSTYWSCP